jgi:hypothetical protein
MKVSIYLVFFHIRFCRTVYVNVTWEFQHLRCSRIVYVIVIVYENVTWEFYLYLKLFMWMLHMRILSIFEIVYVNVTWELLHLWFLHVRFSRIVYVNVRWKFYLYLKLFMWMLHMRVLSIFEIVYVNITWVFLHLWFLHIRFCRIVYVIDTWEFYLYLVSPYSIF